MLTGGHEAIKTNRGLSCCYLATVTQTRYI